MSGEKYDSVDRLVDALVAHPKDLSFRSEPFQALEADFVRSETDTYNRTGGEPAERFVREVKELRDKLRDSEGHAHDRACLNAVRMLGTQALWPRPFPRHLFPFGPRSRELQGLLHEVSHRVRRQIELWEFEAHHSWRPRERAVHAKELLKELALALGGDVQGKQQAPARNRELEDYYYQVLFRYLVAIALVRKHTQRRGPEQSDIQRIAEQCGVPPDILAQHKVLTTARFLALEHTVGRQLN